MTTATTATPGSIKTKHVTGRRDLRFRRMTDLCDDIEQFDAAAVHAGGNWTPGQIVQHVDKVIRIALDGTDATAPWYIRAIAKLMKGAVLNKPMKPGVKLPAKFSSLLPDDDIAWDAAVSGLRESVKRIQAGERMTQPSPAFGPMAHEEWVQLHCRHAEMHFSFLSER